MAFGLVLAGVIVSANLLVVAAIALTLVAVIVALRLPWRPMLLLALYPGIFGAIYAFAAATDPLSAMLIILKAVTAALVAVLLMFTTPYPQVFAPVQRVLPAVIGDALLMTYRSLFLLLEKFGHTLTAVRLRAGFVGVNPIRSAATITRSLGGVLLYSIDLSQRTHDVMYLRGYDGRLAVTPQPSESAALDAGVVVASALLCAARGRLEDLVARTQPLCLDTAARGSRGPCGRHDLARLQKGSGMTKPTGPQAHSHPHPAPTAGEVVRVSCVRHRYEDGTEVALCGLDVVARQGQRIAVLGPNGSGKTTLLFHLLGLLRSEEGIVEVFGVDPARRWKDVRKRIGVVLQNVDEQILAPSVLDDVAFSPRQYGVPEPEVRERVSAVLRRLGIEHLSARVPHNLSGGEKRKVALAGALVMDPELLVLDEPFEGLDPESRTELIALIGAHSEQGGTVIMSTHDIDTVPEFADYCYVLASGGAIVLEGTPAEVFAHPDVLAGGNIRPPLLAEMFARLRELDAGAPEPELTVESAARALAEWKCGRT